MDFVKVGIIVLLREEIPRVHIYFISMKVEFKLNERECIINQYRQSMDKQVIDLRLHP